MPSSDFRTIATRILVTVNTPKSISGNGGKRHLSSTQKMIPQDITTSNAQKWKLTN